MTQTTVVIALLDKEWPPQHSFVDGMLTDVAGREADLKIRLFVSRSSHGDSKPRLYRGVTCTPRLYPRRGVDRFKNFLSTLKLISYQAGREKTRGNRVVLFVRNDPVYLLAASLLRSRVDRLVFQSSFPHEEFSGSLVKRWIAKVLYSVAGRRVDVVTGVSPEGVSRAQRLCPSAIAGDYIPLLADLQLVKPDCTERKCIEDGPIFVYIGTHNAARELSTVMAGIVLAVEQGARAKFRFIGATEADERRLREVVGVNDLLKRGVLSLERPVLREDIPMILSVCDVGVSLIPPKPVYYESSPTKLAEYMGAGLAVLASKGIPMQEMMVRKSGGGELVDWSVDAIAEGFFSLSNRYEAIKRYGENAAVFSRMSLQYRSYLSQFRKLLGVRDIVGGEDDH